MAQEPHTSPSEDAGYGGNAGGVLGEQQHRPGVGEKVKHTLATVGSKIKGHRGEHASYLPGSGYHDDPQMRVGHPSAVYANSSGNSSPSSGSEKGLHHKVRSPRSPQSPRSPRVAVGHNPEFEPLGVGEQAADTVMPGHHMDHHSVPTTPHQPRSEKFIEKLPGHTQNPYTHHENVLAGTPVDSHEHHHSPSPLRDPERQHVVGEPATEDRREEHVKHGEKRTGLVSKLKDLVTGQKPGRGTGTEQATIDQIAESQGAHAVDKNTGNSEKLHDGTHTYAQEPSPVGDLDCFGNVKQKLRAGGNEDAKSPQGWPAPAKPDYHNMQGAVRTDDQGRPVEGPREEGKSPKSEGLMSKIMEKFHIGQQKPASDPELTSPGVPTYTTPDANASKR